MKDIPIIRIDLPEYDFNHSVDFFSIGKKLDNQIKDNFTNKHISIRCITSTDHPDIDKEKLILKIIENGTDRYDPNRMGDRYDNIDNKQIDFFALDFKVDKEVVMMEMILEPFYSWPIGHGKDPIRLDLALIYDMKKLEIVEHQYEGRSDIKRDGFRFLDPEKKIEALLGILSF